MATFDTNDELDFWIGNEKRVASLPEHALFMSLLIPEGTWKTDAQNLYADLEKFRKSRPSDPKKSAATLAAQVDTAIKLTMKLRAYLIALHDKQASGDWVGWGWPLFVDHIRREGDYFVERLSNVEQEPANTELCRVLALSLDHAQFAEHLLDPTEQKKVEEARKFALLFQDITAKGMHDGATKGCAHVTPALLDLSEKAGKGLDRYMRSIAPGPRPGPQGSVQSIIHPVLAEHVVREGRRFLAIIERIKIATLKQRVANLVR